MTERVVWGGRYAIFDEIASGGMATVYLAARLHVDTEVPRVVALKKLSAQFAKQPEFVAMFLDEAHLAARIRHPNVVATYECLRTDEGLGIVMDLVIGASLVSLARAGKGSMNLPPPLPITLAVITGALDGLHAAHQVSDDSGKLLNLVHRDVSPHNILVGRDGVARVIDFGIAKAKGRLQVTDVGVLKGKFAYMSPEQIAGRALDRRADVYSTGIVLWESLAGRKLFRQGGNEEALLQRGDGKVAIPLPSALNPEVPAALDAIVRKALAHDPEERFRSALAMAETIRAEVAVAEPGAVAEWVHGRVGATLDVLATRRAEIEEASLRGDDEGPRRLSNPQVISLGRTSLAPRAPDSDPRSVPARVSVPPSPPVPSRRFMGDFDLAPGSASAVPLELAGPVVSAVPRPSSPGRPRPRRPTAPRVRVGWGLLLVATLFVATMGVGLLEGPALLKLRVMEAARAEGLSLVVDRVELGDGGLTLVGLLVTLPGVPALRLTASEAHATLEGLGSLREVSLPGFELAIAGSPRELATQLSSWRGAHPQHFQISGKAGHVLWGIPSVPSMRVEAHDAWLTTSASNDGGMTLESAGLFVAFPRGSMGPWRTHLDWAPLETRLRVGFDPSATDGPPSATMIYRPVEGTTWALDVPRGSTFKVGLPLGLLGTSSDLAIEAAMHAQVSPRGEMVKAEAQLGLYGWQVGTQPGSGTPIDLVVSGVIQGDPSKPLPLRDGKLALGTVTRAVPGVVTFQSDGMRVELEAPSGRGVEPAAVFDTHEWTTTKPRPTKTSASAH